MSSSPSFQAVHDALRAFGDADPTYSAQLCVQVAGKRVVDLTCGAMQPDSLLPVYSSSKGATAVVVALLVERGQLDLDAARGPLLARVRGMRQGRDHGQAAAVPPSRSARRRRRVHLGGGARARPSRRAPRRAATVLASGPGIHVPRADDRHVGRRARSPRRWPTGRRGAARGGDRSARHRRLDGHARVRGPSSRGGASPDRRGAGGVPPREPGRARERRSGERDGAAAPAT